MNKTPDQNTNRYTEYNLDGTPKRTTASAQRPAGTGRPAENRPDSAHPTQQRRPMNNEERRRLEAARMAAYQNGGRMTAEELRRRQQDQQYLNAAQPGINSQRRVEILDPSGPTSQGQSRTQTTRKKKKRIRINIGLVIFALLMAGVIGFSVHQINENKEQNGTFPGFDFLYGISGDETDGDVSGLPETDGETEPETEPETEAETEDPAEVLWRELYDTISVSNGTMDEGDLILVNYQYGYADTDSVKLANAYEHPRDSGLQVSSRNVAMTEEALNALEAFHQGLYNATGCNDLLINSAYRTVADQQSIYDGYVASNGEEYAKAYVANAGYSEHHTGLACDLTFFIWESANKNYTVPISEHEYGYWLSENCADYGFILRYPEDKVDVTHIAYESWHFRYVGVPHAQAIESLDLCLEEYTEYLRSYTAETKLLYIGADGSLSDVDVSDEIPLSGGWLTYFVPAAEGESTDIPLLQGEAYADYEISGNNVDGFVITVTLN